MNAARWEVRVGVYDAKSHMTYERVLHVQRIIMHEAYDTNTVANDIAILLLSERIQFNDMVSPICMPPASLHITSGQRCLSAGWGDTRGRYAFL